MTHQARCRYDVEHRALTFTGSAVGADMEVTTQPAAVHSRAPAATCDVCMHVVKWPVCSQVVREARVAVFRFASAAVQPG
jgi:hypothetical protein